jgi:hypothetical protein
MLDSGKKKKRVIILESTLCSSSTRRARILCESLVARWENLSASACPSSFSPCSCFSARSASWIGRQSVKFGTHDMQSIGGGGRRRKKQRRAS